MKRLTQPTIKLQSRPARMRGWSLLTCAIVIAGTGGCSLLHDNSQPVQNDNSQQTPFVAPDIDREPMLASSTPHGLSEFSATPLQEDVPFEPRTIRSLRQHSFTSEGSDSDASIDPSGSTMVFASTRHNSAPDIYTKSVDGIAVTQLTADPSWDVQPVYNPKGTHVAFSSNRSGNWDIWVIDLKGRTPIQITDEPGDEVHPSWSPDGKRLVYSRLPPRGQWELWVTETKSAASRRFIGYGLFPTWSPMGDTIAFQRARSRGSQWFSIWTVQLEGGEPGYPTEVAASNEAALITPAWSPDGTRLAFASVSPTPAGSDPASLAAPQSDIYVVNVDGRNKQQLTDGYSANFAPVWSTDGRVYFSTTRGGPETIWSVNPDDAAFNSPDAGSTADAPIEQDPPKISDVGLAKDV
ncbi:MAG: hypothetical protein DHS20C16_18570 [Phycisphaerae bacterium]|nr:MAG: hypothetical protein DHS20C16_18570 [Phycisphaerae bacterium]